MMNAMEDAKKRYIEGNISLQALAREMGLSRSAVQRASQVENWIKQKDEYREANGLEAVKGRNPHSRMLVDRNKARMEYVTGNMALDQLAEKYGVVYGTVKRWSSREKWNLQRGLYRAELMDRVKCADTADASMEPEQLDDILKVVSEKATGTEVVQRSHTKYDYLSLYKRYVTGTESLAEICRQYGLSDESVTVYARVHKWKAARDEYRKHRYAFEIRASIMEAVRNAQMLQENTTKAIKISGRSLDRIDREFDADATGSLAEKLYSMTGTMEKLAKLNLITSGQLSAEEKAHYDFARERLALEEKKLEFMREMKAKGSEDEEVRIELSSELEDLAR